MTKRKAAPVLTAANPMGEARAKLEALGTDWLCEQIAELRSMTQIAALAGVSLGTLIAWVAADSERSARAREARNDTAKGWDDRAVDEIAGATNPFELAKARELAHHFRWRASKIAPREYGDKLEVDASVKLDAVGDLRDFLAGRAGKIKPKAA